jgi:hypothetical protein
MCSYKVKNMLGQSVEVLPTHRITKIDDETVEHYLHDVIPQPVGDIEPTIMQGQKVTIQPLTFSGGVITSGTPSKFFAQVHYDKAREHSSKRSPDTPKTKGRLIMKMANQNQVAKLLEVPFTDALEGKAFANTYAFHGVNVVVTGADEDDGNPGTATPTPVQIAHREVDVTTQYADPGINSVVIGDALVVIDRDLATMAQLQAFAYFTLTPAGGQPIKYTIWNEAGIKQGSTFHHQIYLQLMK